MSDDRTSNQVIGSARAARREYTIDDYRISGDARAAMERGQPSYFSVPLISQVEGNLWQGGCIDGVPLPEDFRHVISLYPWEKYRLGPDTQRVEHEWFDFAEMPLQAELDAAVAAVRDGVSEGKTLVHCQAGLNRSGLVTALYLIRHAEYTPEAAIAKLREGRSPLVLCNETFENWLLALGS